MNYFRIWDVAKMFRLNRVHRIPIVSYDPGRFIADETNLVYFLSLRRIFSEVIFKLKENKCPNLPNLRLMTLKDSKIGTWDGIVTVSFLNSICLLFSCIRNF